LELLKQQQQQQIRRPCQRLSKHQHYQQLLQPLLQPLKGYRQPMG
jgi:hypothetical protein